MSNITVSSGFGHKTQKPFVNVTFGAKDVHLQMSPEEAVAVAHNLLAAAEAAITDAFIIGWLRKVVGVEEDGHIAVALLEFRKFREERDERTSN